MMLLIITIATFLLLVRAFRSIILPIKALLLNGLSIGASYGVMVLVFVLSNWLRLEFTISRGLEKKLVLPAGLVSGFLNGMTNAAGPALAIYLYSLKLTKKEFIKSIAMIFIITKLSQLLAVSTWNLFNSTTLSLSLGVTLFVLLGFYGGLKIQDRINQQTFSRGLMTLLFVIGLTLVLRALTQSA